ncbi:ABC transporter substrate-binding protein [Falsibacillus pallidus]|uniref:Iron complex transport system substrate-binding protein n=1 Tax=Falsibacillus pallidus TaxID=493781 RepID=A0A370GRD1_9BACI|nr:ABC transporter substrate-binding protein [Falsibacillus pallidus]RDI45796.1 iron complex transport system substrate-binding protein [Falsibacillus pallidus]
MKRIITLLFSILLIAGLMTGCAQDAKNETGKDQQGKTEQSKEAAFPTTFKDAIGNEITLKEEPKKIVSLIPSNTEVVYGLGMGDKIVGVTDFDNYPKEVAKKEKIGNMVFNVEKIIGLQPDVVLAHESTAKSAEAGLKQIKDAGIPVVVINDANNFDSVYQSIELIGKTIGAKDQADKMVNRMKEKINAIAEKAQSIPDDQMKSVYVEVSPEPELFTTGKGTFLDEMLQIIHAKNAAGDQEGWAKMSDESVIALKPDVIITTCGAFVKDPVNDILNRKGWEQVPAIQNKQVYDVDTDLVTRSGPRLAEGIEELAKVIYPEKFAK